MARRVVVLFGGSGFIGRHLVQRLTASGWTVRVGVRDPEGALFLKTMGEAGQVVPVWADVTDPTSVRPVLDEAEAAVNLVGVLYSRREQSFRRIHVDGAANVAICASEAGVSSVVHVSALGANPDSSSEYARTKAQGEAAVKQAFPDAAIIRPSVVFGPEDQFFNRLARVARYAPVLPVLPARFQPVYVGDVADAISRVLTDQMGRGKVYELGGPHLMTFRQACEFVLSATNRKRILLPVPLSLAFVQAIFLEWLPNPPITRDQVRLLANANIVDGHAPGFAELGIVPKPVEAIVPVYLRQFSRRSAPQTLMSG